MPRVRVIHWKPAEAEPLVAACRAAGFEVEFDGALDARETGKAIQENRPDAVVIDSTRVPSHGRMFALWLGERKATREIPVLLLDGAAQALSPAKLKQKIKAAIRDWIPPERVESHSTKTTAEKLGLKPGGTLAVLDAPRDVGAVIGPLPEGAQLDESDSGDVTLWFLHDEASLLDNLQTLRRLAPNTKLWTAWRKGGRDGLKEDGIREAAIGVGLVDYKVCCLNPTWSAIALARRKPK